MPTALYVGCQASIVDWLGAAQVSKALPVKLPVATTDGATAAGCTACADLDVDTTRPVARTSFAFCSSPGA
jgi:hypothetical protein